jgi:VCBS repeat-containing protein
VLSGATTVSPTFVADVAGTYTARLIVNDGTVNSTPDSVTITVTNAAPVAQDQPGVTTNEDVPVNVTLAATDDDGDALTYTVVTLPSNGVLSGTEPNLTYTPNLNYSGEDSFTFLANDGTEDSNTATVSITINPVNDAPVIAGLAKQLSTLEDTSLTISITDFVVSDPDNAFPTDFTLVLQDGLNYTRAGNTITPDLNFNGQLSVPATVSDLEPLESPIFLIPVVVTAENDAPVLQVEIGPRIAVENSLFELNASENFTDADGDTLTFLATGLPASGSIAIDPVTGIISGTPTVQDARDNEPYIVIVTAEDPSGAFVSDTFDLTVSALDRANIGLTIGVTPETGLPNDQLQWTFMAANQGPAPGENVELRGSFFGEGLSVAAGGGANCTIDLRSGRADFVCTVGALSVDVAASVSFTTTASQATEVVAFGTAAGALAVPIDPNISDNSAVRAVGIADSFSDGAVQFLGDSTIRSVAAGDFNGDGRLDLIVGTAAGQPIQIYLGDEPRESCGCQRDFLATSISVPDTGSNEGIAVADFDNDRNLDFVIANSGGQPDAVYRNDGAANFALAIALPPSNGRGVAVGDFNNDGNMDIAIAATSPNSVYFGDGAGGFGDAILLGDAESFDVAVGRFDDDLFDDLVFANVGSDSQVWINNGGTGFTPGTVLPIGDAVSVAAADLNGDNLDDLVFGRIPDGSDDVPANPVMINQGGGAFGDSPVLLGISPTADVLIGDVSDDGVPDIVFINASGLHQTWVADGAGYTLHGEQIIDIDARVGVLANLGFADTDDPGGVDLALGGAIDAGAAVYLNDSIGNLGLGDAVAPVITLNGVASIDVPSGEVYTDSGAAAADNIDGDISASIIVNNPVNTAVVGAYTVTYNVQDFAGNAAVQVTRTVNVTAAVGRGGGGGGALDYWFAALLAVAWMLLLLRTGGRLAARRHDLQ